MPGHSEVNLCSVLSLGKDLSKITMPVIFNEPLSFLQRVAEYMEYAKLLKQAAQEETPIKRLQVNFFFFNWKVFFYLDWIQFIIWSMITVRRCFCCKCFGFELGKTWQTLQPDTWRNVRTGTWRFSVSNNKVQATGKFIVWYK